MSKKDPAKDPNPPAKTAPAKVAPAAVTATGGLSQKTKVSTKEVHSKFPSPLQVTVLDDKGKPVVGAKVTLNTPETGPSAAFPSGEITLDVYTNDKGVATSPILMANTEAGKYQVTATVEDSDTVGFDLENLA